MAAAPPPSPAGTMKLVAGDPALDFVNTVGGWLPARRGRERRVHNDKLAAYDDLLAFAVHRKLLTETRGRALARKGRMKPAAARVLLERARAFREALHRALSAVMGGRRPPASDLGTLNTEILACREREALKPRGRGLQWEWLREAEGLEA